MIPRLSIAALALCAALVAAMPASAVSAANPYVKVISMTSVVAKNDQATIVASVTPSNAKCNLVIYLRSGPSAASGLGPKRAVKGRVSWTWRVSQNTTGGTWPVYVECGTTGIAKTFIRII